MVDPEKNFEHEPKSRYSLREFACMGNILFVCEDVAE